MTALREVVALFSPKLDEAAVKKVDGFVNKTIGQIKSLASSFGGVFALGGAVARLQQLRGEIDETAKSAHTLGLRSESLNAWRQAAGEAGAAQNDLNDGFRTLSNFMLQVQKGSAGAAQALGNLGLEAEDLSGIPLDQQLMTVGNALVEMEDITLRNATAQKLLGGQGARLIRMFEGGAEATAGLISELEKSAPFTDEQAAKFEAMNDAMSRTDRAMDAVIIQFAVLLVPALEMTSKAITVVLGTVKELTEENYVLETSMVVLAGVIISKMVPAIAAWVAQNTALLLSYARLVLGAAALILIVDDLIAAFNGGESVIGDAIDGMFGEGTTKKIVAFVKELRSPVKFLKRMVDDFKFIGEQFLGWVGGWITKLIDSLNIPSLKSIIGAITGATGATFSTASAPGGSGPGGNVGGVSQTNNIHVEGATDPAAVASAVGGAVNTAGQNLSAAHKALTQRRRP